MNPQVRCRSHEQLSVSSGSILKRPRQSAETRHECTGRRRKTLRPRHALVPKLNYLPNLFCGEFFAPNTPQEPTSSLKILDLAGLEQVRESRRIKSVLIRVSTKEQTENLSLPTQLRACEEYCARNGYEVLARFKEEGEREDCRPTGASTDARVLPRAQGEGSLCRRLQPHTLRAREVRLRRAS